MDEMWQGSGSELCGEGDLDEGGGREELPLEGGGRLVVGSDLGHGVEGASDPQQEGPVLELLGEDGLDVVRVLCNNKVSETQVAQNEVVLAHELLELVQLDAVLLQDFWAGGLVVLVEEEALDCPCDLVEDGEEAFEAGVVVVVPAQQFGLAPALDDVLLDGGGLGELEVAVEQVGQVGEAESQSLLVLPEPLLRLRVVVVLEVHARVGQKQSRHLASPADAPVAETDGVQFGREGGGGRQEEALDGVGTLVVGLDLGEGLEVVANPPPEGVVGLLAGVERLEVVEVLGQQEVRESQVAQRELPLPHEVAQGVELRPRLLQQVDLETLVVLVPEERLDVLEGVGDHAHDAVDVAGVLRVAAEEVGLARAANDVPGDGGGLGELEVGVDEVGQVGEVEAETLLVLLEPLLPRVVLHLLEGQPAVRQQQSQVLPQPAHLPVPEHQVAHKI